MARDQSESKRCKRSYIKFPIIAKAVTGDADAIKLVTAFYDSYIRSFCYHRNNDRYDEDTYYFDEVMYQMLKSKLVESVLLKFDL